MTNDPDESASAAPTQRLPARGRNGPDTRRFRATPEAEARLLLLIDEFSRTPRGVPRTLEGRVKLAKLDFLLRYPQHLDRILRIRGVKESILQALADQSTDDAPLDARMMRYRYGPWDPAYYALLGSLLGRGLIEMLPLEGRTGFGYRTTERGADAAAALASDEIFAPVLSRLKVLKRHLDLSGTTLKSTLYLLPEVSGTSWTEDLQ